MLFRFRELRLEEVRDAFSKIRLAQNKIIVTRDEQLVSSYIQILARLFMNWSHRETFQEQFWVDFLVNFCEILNFYPDKQYEILSEIIKNYLRDILVYFVSEGIIDLEGKKNSTHKNLKDEIVRKVVSFLHFF